MTAPALMCGAHPRSIAARTAFSKAPIEVGGVVGIRVEALIFECALDLPHHATIRCRLPEGAPNARVDELARSLGAHGSITWNTRRLQ